MSNLKAFQELKKELQASNTQLIAVSKTQPIEAIMELYTAGQRVFGENLVQELVEKQERLPKDIEWHLIGHLQSNKVKYIAPFVSLIHGVDSLKLLIEINKQALKNKRVIDCLLQIYIADEDTKYGLDFDEAIELLRSDEFKKLQNIRICGVMGIATNTPKLDFIKEEFYELSMIFNGLKQSFFRKEASFKELSMGMSADYEVAIEQGSTMVRVGSLLFGKRQKTNE